MCKSPTEYGYTCEDGVCIIMSNGEFGNDSTCGGGVIGHVIMKQKNV
jgi:hypothetical protein